MVGVRGWERRSLTNWIKLFARLRMIRSESLQMSKACEAGGCGGFRSGFGTPPIQVGYGLWQLRTCAAARVIGGSGSENETIAGDGSGIIEAACSTS